MPTTNHTGITHVTRSPRALGLHPCPTAGEEWVYQVMQPFQIGPTQAGLFANIRLCRTPVVDLEVGTDLIVFDDREQIGPENAVALCRGRTVKHPRTDELVRMVPAAQGGFVPLGARRPDGSPHPHAGTGFALAAAAGYPLKLAEQKDTHLDVQSDVYLTCELIQLAFDGRQVRVTHTEAMDADRLIPGHTVLFQARSAAIPSGDDLLCGVDVGTFGQWNTICVRWRRRKSDGCWYPVSHTPVASHSQESSLIRDNDGSLIMAVRPWWATTPTRTHLDIYRSIDEGVTWAQVMHQDVLKTDAPLIIARALDGTVYFATNRFREPPVNRFAKREMIWLWPLSPDRARLLDPVVVRDGPGEWGPTPTSGSIWRVDHPVGTNLCLADGWHHIITYRGLEDAEMRTDAGPTPHTGAYVEEVVTPGPPRIEHDWRF